MRSLRSWTALARLEVLYLEGNVLSGEDPWQLGNLTRLNHLILYGNKLTGKFEASFLRLSFLESLYWDGNDGLCMPVEQDFRDWLSRMDWRSSGPYCAPVVLDSLLFGEWNFAGTEMSVRIGENVKRYLTAGEETPLLYDTDDLVESFI